MAYKIFDQSAKIPSYVNDFLHRYKATASLGEVEKRYRSQPYNYSLGAKTWEEESLMVETYYQSTIQMKLSEEDFKQLIEDTTSVEELRKQYGPNIIRYIEDATAVANLRNYEERVRRQNPGVQLAWEKYQMMLKIAGG